MPASPAEALHLVDLEPSLVRRRTYISRRRIGKVDSATVLIVTIALATVIPERLVLPGFPPGSARPALVLSMAMLVWWLIGKLSPGLAMTGPQPLRWVAMIFTADILVSYAAGFIRGLTTIESNAADRFLLLTAAICGLVLLATDGVRNWERLDAVLKALVWCAAFMALVGIIESILVVDVTKYLVVPGLREGAPGADLEIRGAGVRVGSTTADKIEFSVCMALALPFAIHFSLYGKSAKARRMYWVLTAAIAASIPLTISRTGIICVAVALVILAQLWSWRLRYNLFAVAAIFGVTLAGVKPGLIGTLRGMFSGAGNDPSVTSRTERYDMANYFFVQHPWLGRGTGTWVSPQYQYLDNQWFTTALTNGTVGVAALATLYISGIVLAAIAWRRATTVRVRHLAAALICAQVTAIIASATFDSLFYTTYVIMDALLLGLSGAIWRLSHPDRVVRTAAVPATDT
jgi:O-antigen ligase